MSNNLIPVGAQLVDQVDLTITDVVRVRMQDGVFAFEVDTLAIAKLTAEERGRFSAAMAAVERLILSSTHSTVKQYGMIAPHA